MPQSGTYAIEILTHFHCPHCTKWWSIGDPDSSKQHWYCPWCGEESHFDLPHSAASPAASSEEPPGTALHSTPEAQARREAVRRENRRKGLVIVNTGKGKGKSTAAFGVVMRAWGRDMRVGGIQFFKHANAHYGELRALERMGIELKPMGDGFTWTSRDMDETQAKALHGWQVAQQQIVSANYDIFLLDEFTYLLHFGWLDTVEVVAWLRANKPEMLHLLITGRDAPPALIDFADMVTEMHEIKHPFKEQGIKAQKGIEF
jgi:cob(I)alamin adenosyltransferase